MPREAEDHSSVYVPGPDKATEVVSVGTDPQLFLDDYFFGAAPDDLNGLCGG